MAYQINGNVVIDDSGNGFFENLPAIITPTIIEPAEGEDLFPGNATILASNFSSAYNDFYASRFEVANVISFDAANIVYDSGNIIPGSNTTTTTALGTNIIYYGRVTYFASESISVTSPVRTFCTKDIPDTLGQPFGGGYYTGTINIGANVCYYLVVAPNAEGCAACAWKPTGTVTSGAFSFCDGYLNTYDYLDNATHPAGNWTATRTIGGYTDWYLPSTSELTVMYQNKGTLPAGEGYCDLVCPGNINQTAYWSSLQQTNPSYTWSKLYSCVIRMQNGSFAFLRKFYGLRTRAIRRVPVAPSP